MVTRTITYKLYPGIQATNTLHWARKMHCDLYNASLRNRKNQYQRWGNSISYFDQQRSLTELKKELPEYAQLACNSLQNTLKRVYFAYQCFFKGLSKYPRFKGKHRYRGWTYPCKSGWKLHTNNGVNGKLELKDLGLSLRMRGQARTWATPKTCTIVWDGKDWYASITVDCVPERQTGNNAVGLDFGYNTAISFSNGNTVEAPKFQAQAQQKVNQLSQNLQRKKKPIKGRTKASRRWKKYQDKIKKVKKTEANRRRDWSHQVAAQIVSGNSLVATEKLNLQGMTRKGKRQKAGLNNSILDIAIGKTKHLIKYQVEEANGVYLKAPTQQLKPTQPCAKFGDLCLSH